MKLVFACTTYITMANLELIKLAKGIEDVVVYDLMNGAIWKSDKKPQ